MRKLAAILVVVPMVEDVGAVEGTQKFLSFRLTSKGTGQTKR